MNTSPATKHAGSTGIRVNVLKPGLKQRTEANRKSDWTAVYVRGRDLEQLLPLADGNTQLLTAAVRKAALTVSLNAHRNYSRACVAGAMRLLQKARAEAESIAAKAAADNNAQWE